MADVGRRKKLSSDPEEVARLLQFADADKTDVLESFLGIGVGNGEGMVGL
jgi:hypothetical protein